MIAKYVGRGAYVQGVPAKDLEEEEWDALSERQQSLALEHTHELAGRRKSTPTVEVEEEAIEDATTY